MTLAASYDGADASQQFPHVTRGRQDVIGALVEHLHLGVERRRTVRQDKDRYLERGGAHRTHHPVRRTIGELQLHQHEVVIIKAQELQGLVPSCRALAADAVGPEGFRETARREGAGFANS